MSSKPVSEVVDLRQTIEAEGGKFVIKTISLTGVPTADWSPRTMGFMGLKAVWGNSNSVYFIMDFPALFNYNIIS